MDRSGKGYLPEGCREGKAMWDQFTITCHQLWMWVKYEVSVHPFLFAGIVIVIITAFILYNSEVEGS